LPMTFISTVTIWKNTRNTPELYWHLSRKPASM
jgi:hypothetical protein